MSDYGMVTTEMVFGFSSLHPWLCFAYFIILVCSNMLWLHPVYLLVTLTVVIALNLSIDRGRSMRKSMKGYLLIAVIVFVTNPFFSGRGAKVLFYIFDRPFTLESVAYGALYAVSLLNILLAFAAYSLIVTPDKFLYLLSPILPRSAFVIAIALRFVPLLMSRLKQIMLIQQLLGALNHQGSKRRLIREGMDTLHALISWSLEEALQTAGSMRARGYGVGLRSSAVVYRMERRDVFVLWVMILTGVHVMIGALYGVNRYDIYPVLQSPAWTPEVGLHLSCFVILISIPVVLNVKEWLYWRIIRSRM
jgi:energy-coupling factor transport system permease protein